MCGACEVGLRKALKARDKGEPYHLRWLKSQRVCCVPFCTSAIKAEKHEFTWDVICHSVGIASVSPPVDTSQCSVHYSQVYRSLNVSFKACVCCEVEKRQSTATFITCPSPDLVESYLRETIDFCDTIQEGDLVYYSCYKFLNGKLKSGECMLSSQDIILKLEAKLAELKKIVAEFHCTSTESCVKLCLYKAALSACELLVSDRAFLFPHMF